MPAPLPMNPAARASRLEALLPTGTIGAELREQVDATLLLPDEFVHVAKAGAKRVADFAGGRVCARRALAELGIPDFAVRAAEDRRPLWPEGIVGSITHTHGYCAAVAAPFSRLQAVGIDAEVIDRVNDTIRKAVCTELEADWLAGLDDTARALAAALIFSGKEAFYKCQYTLSQQWLDFQDACLDFDCTDLQAGRFALRVLKPVPAIEGLALEGRFLVDGPLIVTSMAFAAAAGTRS